ncbi:MAG: DUF192 domain-containing protein [Spirochaetales bacterium]|nr:DUF192 domain-containing protein [Spirochaetales bacterium]
MEINGKKFTVEVAIKQEDLSRGLMFRKKMAEDQGMLFVFERDRNMSFWMKNTSIPLSVAYISSEGIIREIYDMKPQSLASVESKYKTRYALELNQGAYERAGIKPGDKVVFPPEFTEMLP